MKKELTNAFGKVFLAINFDQTDGYWCNDWQGYQTLEGVMRGANTYLELMAERPNPYLLNDNTNVRGPWDHAVEWIAQDWTPRAIAQGLSHFAHVVSPESFAALSAEAMFASVGTVFQMRIFGNVAEARQWLREAQRVPVAG